MRVNLHKMCRKTHKLSQCPYVKFHNHSFITGAMTAAEVELDTNLTQEVSLLNHGYSSKEDIITSDV